MERVSINPNEYSATLVAATAHLSSPKLKELLETVGIKPVRETKNGSRLYSVYGFNAYEWALAYRNQKIQAHNDAEAARIEKRRKKEEARVNKTRQLKLDLQHNKEQDKEVLRAEKGVHPLQSHADIVAAINDVAAAIRELCVVWKGQQ